MPYILYRTDGTKQATVDDATLDLSTDLAFVGRNYSGYGQIVNENFLKLLENFSSNSAPSNPIRGQLWYDKLNGRLNVSYDGKSFKGIASIFVQPATPSSSALVRGDLWWDSDAFQLKAFDGSVFQIVGPFTPAAGRATWIPGEENTGDINVASTPISKATIDEELIAIVARQTFTTTSILSLNFPVIKRGLTLFGSNASTGKSAQSLNDNTGTFIWGTAAHSITADFATTATYADFLSSGGANALLSSRTDITQYSVASTSSIAWTIAERDANANLHANLFVGIATSARYADIAERYEADAVYEPGTVLMHGGEKEVTLACLHATTAVAGIVSTKPAYMMNSDAGSDETHPFIALKGRVPCKIYGSVKKGDLLVSSGYNPGHATKKQDHDSSDAVIGKALEDFEGSFGVIEVKV
jgi:hypothetical protein